LFEHVIEISFAITGAGVTLRVKKIGRTFKVIELSGNSTSEYGYTINLATLPNQVWLNVNQETNLIKSLIHYIGLQQFRCICYRFKTFM